MTVLPLVYYPDPLLRERCAPVEQITPEILQLLKDMEDTMYANDGLGLAAIQIGVLKRVVVIDVSQKTGEREPIYIINPELIETGGEETPYTEGCLSIPEIYEDIYRPNEARVRYMNEKGETVEISGVGLLAKALQHEIDHLNGVLFTDHLSKLKRDRALKKYQKLRKQIQE